MHPTGGGSYPSQYINNQTSQQQQQFMQHQQMMGGGQPGTNYQQQQGFPGQQQIIMTQSSNMQQGGGMTIQSSAPQQPPFQIVRERAPGLQQMPMNIGSQSMQQQYTTGYQQPQMGGAPNYTVAPPQGQMPGQGPPGGSLQQPISAQQQAPPPHQQFVFEPILKARNLIQKELRSGLMNLMKSANELMKLKAQIAVEEQAAIAEATVATSVGTAEKQDIKVGKRARSLSQTSIQVQKYLDQFYAICDQLEYQFLMILECQRESKVADKNIPVKIKIDENPQTSGGISFPRYRMFAEDQIRHANSVQEALEVCIKQLGDVRSKDNEELCEETGSAKKIKLEQNEENNY